MARLKVQFAYPDHNKPLADTAAAGGAGAGEEEAGGGTRFASSRASAPSPSGSGYSTSEAAGASLGSSYEACWAELQALKKKYDEVREYTVHLTADRDSIVAKLERLQSEAAQQAAGAGAGAGGKNAAARAGSALKETARGVAVSDYSLFVVLLAAVVSFLVGYFVST